MKPYGKESGLIEKRDQLGGGKYSFLASGKVGKLPIVSKVLFQTRINLFQQPFGVIQARMIMPQEK